MGVVIFNGVSSKDYGIVVEHPPNYEIPERDCEITHIPGRNGDLIVDNGSFKNVEREYELAIGSYDATFASIANLLSEWLCAGVGYRRLEDSYEPEYYRLASYHESNSIENIYFHGGRMTAVFDCKPQRFLKLGETTVKFAEPGTIFNPTGFASLPTVTIKGSGIGVLSIGGYSISISELADGLTINSDLQDVYLGTLNKNSVVTLANGFPKLAPGENNISFSGGITSVEVVPKWWTL